MTITRRIFTGRLGAGIASLSVIGSTIFTTACPAGIVGVISSYIGIGLNAFQAVIDMLSGAGVVNPVEGSVIDMVINAVKAGFADIQAAITAYNNAPAANKSTFLGKISTVISVTIAQIQTFWNDLKIPDANLANTIKGLLGIILSTLAGFLPQLPAVGAAGVTATEKVKALQNTIPYTPQFRKPSEFKQEFNNLLDKNGYSQHKI